MSSDDDASPADVAFELSDDDDVGPVRSLAQKRKDAKEQEAKDKAE